MTLRPRVGRYLLLLLSAQAMVYAGDIALRHIADPNWPTHARYHLGVSAVHIASVAVVVAMLAWRGDVTRSRLLWGVVALLMILSWLGWPVARLVAGEPTPPEVLGVLAAMLLEIVAALYFSYPLSEVTTESTLRA